MSKKDESNIESSLSEGSSLSPQDLRNMLEYYIELRELSDNKSSYTNSLNNYYRLVE